MNNTQHVWNSLLSNIPRISSAERVYQVKLVKSALKLLMQRKQMYKMWVKNISQKFAKQGRLVMDDFAGTLSVVEDYKNFIKHKSFID